MDNKINDSLRQSVIKHFKDNLTNLYLTFAYKGISATNRRSDFPSSTQYKLAIKATEIKFAIKASEVESAPTGATLVLDDTYYVIDTLPVGEDHKFNSLYLVFNGTTPITPETAYTFLSVISDIYDDNASAYYTSSIIEGADLRSNGNFDNSVLLMQGFVPETTIPISTEKTFTMIVRF